MSRLFTNPYLLLTLASLFWGGNAVAGKLAVGEISFIELTFYRWLLATLLLLPFAWRYLKQDWHQIQQTWLLLFALGTIGFTGFNLTMYWALHYTSVMNIVIEQTTIPLFVFILNFLLFKITTTRLQIVALFCVSTGVILTVTKGNVIALLENGINKGDGIILISVLIYALYSVALKWKPAIHWLSFLFCLAFFAMLSSLVFFILLQQQTGFVLPTLRGFSLILYVGIFPSIFAQLFYIRGIELTSTATSKFN